MNTIQNDVIYSDWFIFNLIENITTPKILYNLKLTNKWHFKEIKIQNIKQVVIKNIIIKLKEFTNINYNDFVSYLEQNNMSISGSFVLQCILDEYWDGSDIDLYSDVNKDTYDDSLFYDNNYNIFDKSGDEGYDAGGIKGIHTFSNSNKKYCHLQMIFLNDTDVFKYVKKCYDLIICKNVYRIKNGKHSLYIDNLQNIMEKEIPCNFMNLTASFPSRKIKYENRGFVYKNVKLGNYILYNECYIPIIIYDKKLNKVSLFNETFDFNPIEDFKCKFEYENTKLKINKNEFLMENKNCRHSAVLDYSEGVYLNIKTNCPIDCLSDIKHYHAKFIIDKQDYVCIIVEKSDNTILYLYNDIQKNKSIFINLEDFFVQYVYKQNKFLF